MHVLSTLCALAATVVLTITSAHADDKSPLSPFVVVGDSLAAGFQNFSLLESQQVKGPANLIARQAGVPLHLPLVPYPGVPNVLQVVSVGPPPVVAPVPGLPPSPPRTNVFLQATNLAVPGQTVGEAIVKTPTSTPVTPIDFLTNIVLGFPPGDPKSQLQTALTLSPNFILLWIGNNDALFYALTGVPGTLTDAAAFSVAYTYLSDSLAETNAKMVFVNIPDVTSIPYLTSLTKLSTQTGVPAPILAAALNMSAGDYLRPGALPVVQAILAGQRPGFAPGELCVSVIPGIASVPCMLTAVEADAIRTRIAAFNQVISARAQAKGAAYVDLNALVADIARNGYKVDGRTLTTDFRGGLYSLDAIHPTNTGYAILANEILEQMKRQLHININKVNLVQVLKDDPLVPAR